jgi:nitrogen PTS system EIIA component
MREKPGEAALGSRVCSTCPPGFSAPTLPIRECCRKFPKLNEAKGLNEVRDHLLALIGTSREAVGPDTRACMIQLQARQIVASIPAYDLASLVLEPVIIISGPGLKHFVLAQDPQLVEYLDAAPRLVERLASEGVFQNGGWRILKRGETAYQGERVLYDCLAIRVANSNSSIAAKF